MKTRNGTNNNSHQFSCTLLKIFAFLLCFVLYVYVMIFQFEIKHKVLCKRIHIIQECRSNIAFFADIKISYALNFSSFSCVILILWYCFIVVVASTMKGKVPTAIPLVFWKQNFSEGYCSKINIELHKMRIKNLHASNWGMFSAKRIKRK